MLLFVSFIECRNMINTVPVRVQSIKCTTTQYLLTSNDGGTVKEGADLSFSFLTLR